MKVLIINSLDKNYGSTYRIRKFYEILKNSEFDVKYVESNSSELEGVKNVGQIKGFFGFIIGTLHRIIISLFYKYDLLLIQKFIPLTIFSIIIARLRKKKVVVDWDDIDTDLQSTKFRKMLCYLCEKWGPRLAHKITTHSKIISDIATKRTKNKVELINQGVDFELFSPEKQKESKNKIDFNLKGKKILGYICTFTEGGAKDIENVIRVAGDIIRDESDFVLMIVGGGPKEIYVRSIIDRYGISEFTYLTGLVEQNEIPGYLALFNTSMIYMSNSPGNVARVSFKVLESLAMGINVAGHIVGETKERFGKYIIQTENDPESFKRGILESIETEVDMKDIRNDLIDVYSWEKIAKKLITTIKEIS